MYEVGVSFRVRVRAMVRAMVMVRARIMDRARFSDRARAQVKDRTLTLAWPYCSWPSCTLAMENSLST